MKRLPLALFSGVVTLLVSAPSNAYCIINQTSDVLYTQLADSSPLSKFNREIRPGKKACCDWFDRWCNPTGTRGALVRIIIEGEERRSKWEKAVKNKLENRKKGQSAAGVLNALQIPDKFNALYCVHGFEQNVLASSGGTVVISKNITRPGKLNCESRDYFLRPVRSKSRAFNGGVPLLSVPPPRYTPRKRPTIREQLSR